MTQPETTMDDLLKEMKDEMVTLTSKVEELQQRQARELTVQVREGDDNDNKWLGNFVTLAPWSRSLHKLFWRQHSRILLLVG